MTEVVYGPPPTTVPLLGSSPHDVPASRYRRGGRRARRGRDARARDGRRRARGRRGRRWTRRRTRKAEQVDLVVVSRRYGLAPGDDPQLHTARPRLALRGYPHHDWGERRCTHRHRLVLVDALRERCLTLRRNY